MHENIESASHNISHIVLFIVISYQKCDINVTKQEIEPEPYSSHFARKYYNLVTLLRKNYLTDN